MNPLLKPYFVRYCSRQVVNSMEEDFAGNAKRILRYFDRYEISYQSSIVDRIEIRLDFTQLCHAGTLIVIVIIIDTIVLWWLGMESLYLLVPTPIVFLFYSLLSTKRPPMLWGSTCRAVTFSDCTNSSTDQATRISVNRTRTSTY